MSLWTLYRHKRFGGVTPYIPNHRIRQRSVVIFRPRKELPVPAEWEAVWDLDRIWRREKSLSPTVSQVITQNALSRRPGRCLRIKCIIHAYQIYPRATRSAGNDINFYCHLINSEFSSEVPYLTSCFHSLCTQQENKQISPHTIKWFLKFSALYINNFLIERHKNSNSDFSLGQSLLFFQLNTHNMLNTYIYHKLHPRCFGVCYIVFRWTIALLAQSYEY
jgi:hypothetical protein